MIQGFLPTIQQDAFQIFCYITNKEFRETDQQEKTYLAAKRVLGTISMMFGALVAVRAAAFVVSNPVGAVLAIALGVGLYALGHDAFVIAKNQDEKLDLDDDNTVGIGIIESRIPARLITEGTFFPSLWNFFIPPSSKGD